MESSSKVTMWERTKATSKSWFDKVGADVNKLSNKLGAEAFWPTSLDKESDKAARILRSFCIDGCMSEQGNGKQGNNKKSKSLSRIPQEASLSSRSQTARRENSPL
jgi:hypothetical protein